MATVQELVAQINAGSFASVYAAEDEIDMAGVTRVATVDSDEHRWYVMGTRVFKVGGEFFGVHGPVSLKSESMGFADVGETCEAFEMDAVPTVTYLRKPAA